MQVSAEDKTEGRVGLVLSGLRRCQARQTSKATLLSFDMHGKSLIRVFKFRRYDWRCSMMIRVKIALNTSKHRGTSLRQQGVSSCVTFEA